MRGDPCIRNRHPCGNNGPNVGAEYTGEEIDFMMAMERYKRRNQRPFPTWHEVLEVVLALGYRKVELPREPKRPAHLPT